jgi:hypothetical protein
MNKFEIEIVNYFEKQKLVAEIYYDSLQWAEIAKKSEGLIIQFSPHPSKAYWEFPCEEAIKTLERAKAQLLITKNTGSFVERMLPVGPIEVNEQAEKILEGIINHPERKVIQGRLERFGDVVDIYAPSMGGARYTIEGEFIGFLEP